MNEAGFVVVSMAGLWIAYLVPHRLRYRQQLLESRADDRFSERLRVLRVAQVADQGPVVTGRRKGLVARRANGRVQGPDERPEVRQARVQLHVARAPVPAPRQTAAPGREVRGGGSMDRPHATRDRVAADAARHSAAEHAQRAAALARRAAAARRRAALTLALVVVVAAGWSVVGLAGATVLLGVVPTVALGAVLTLGRRAVVSAARADAAWEAGAATRAPLPASSRRTGAVGRAVRPSDATTEVMARIAAQAPLAAPASASEAAPTVTDGEASRAGLRTADPEPGSGTWAPVPVPRPAYTLKPAARRAEPVPLVLDQPDVRAAQAGDHASTSVSDDAATAGGEVAPGQATTDSSGATVSPDPAAGPARTAPRGAALDLDAILARRRASGE